MNILNLEEKYYKKLNLFLSSADERVSLKYRVSALGELNSCRIDDFKKNNLFNKFNYYMEHLKENIRKEDIDHLKTSVIQNKEKLQNDLDVVIRASVHEDFFSETFDKHYYAISSYYFLAEGLKSLGFYVDNLIKTNDEIKNNVRLASINCINCYCGTLIEIHGKKNSKMIDYMPNLFFNWRSPESWWDDILIYGAMKFFNIDTNEIVFYEENIGGLDLSEIGSDYIKY